MAELVLRLRDREMARVGVVKTAMTIGRDASCDLVIDNAAISRVHATVTFDNLSYRVQDQDSENGITVNGRRGRKGPLEYGDVIGIGKFEIELVESWHEPVQQGAPQAKDATKNVMKTMQVDAGTAARLRDEAMARIAAQKGLPAPVPKAPPRSPPSAAPSRAPAPNPPASGASNTFKMTLLVIFALVVGAVLTLFLVR